MKLVGRGFTFGGRRYEPGDLFDLDRLPGWQQPTFVRLYQLADPPPKRAKVKKQDDFGEEAAEENP